MPLPEQDAILARVHRYSLPRPCRPKAPPIKSQGIKTKLVPFILGTVRWDGAGRWVEPFLGSGAVLLNAAPPRALVADTNKHLVRVYMAIQAGDLTPDRLRQFLQREGRALLEKGEGHYYAIRERFNREGSPYDFLFLNRACFNGMVRFNRKGEFNVPFCRKPDRFRPAYITKICNQARWAAAVMKDKDWAFVVQDWRTTLAEAQAADFVYVDPPYVGRHTDYYNSWSASETMELASVLKALPVPFAYSTWKANKYRTNQHVNEFAGYPVLTFEHFYHVGPTESLRNAMEEALIVSPRAMADQPWVRPTKPSQASLAL